MRHYRSAFSLVEMLIAVILISLLIAIAVFSFKHQLITISKMKKTGLNKVIIYNQLRTSLESIKYYVVDDYDIMGRPMKKLHLYFNGNALEMKYITEDPLFSNTTAVAKLECLDDQLVYTEEPLYGNIDYLKPNIKEDSVKTVFYKDLESCKINYIMENQQYNKYINDIPSDIFIEFTQNEILEQIYVNIKSDYNLSKAKVYEAIYPFE